MKFVVEIPVDNDADRFPDGSVDTLALAVHLERVAHYLRGGQFMRQFIDANGNRVEMRCEIVNEPDATEGSPR